MKRMKEPVKLREKTLSDGNVSLYLDIYFNGVRKYEFLKLYLLPGRTADVRQRNEKTLAIANSIKAKRIIDIQSGAYDVTIKNDDAPFFPFYDKVRNMRESRIKSRDWNVVRRHILALCKTESFTFKSIDRKFVEAFREVIDGLEIKEGTKHIYWKIFILVMNQAMRDSVLQKNPCEGIQGFKPSEAKRLYLTAKEVTIMANTPCSNDIIRRSFLFSCLTGLRMSDVRALTWDDVTEENGYTRIIFRQKKTHWQEYLDINKAAASLMGERAEGLIFHLTYAHQYINRVIKAWAEASGIKKDISFHVARHTFATMMLSNGVDLYTVSKLVGHRSISTTQIYAKVMDKEKQRAVDTIPSDII